MPWIVKTLVVLALTSIAANMFHGGMVRQDAAAGFQAREQERLNRLAALYRQYRHMMDPDILARVEAELRRAGIIWQPFTE